MVKRGKRTENAIVGLLVFFMILLCVFWLRHESQVKQWKQELQYLGRDNLLVGRVANVEALRQEFETLL